MMRRSEQEAEAMFVQRRGCSLRGQPDRDAQGLQDIGRAGLRGDGAVAVLGDLGSGGGGDQAGGGGDVEGAAGVAAGAAGVD
jgi:hypothetical protein